MVDLEIGEELYELQQEYFKVLNEESEAQAQKLDTKDD